MNGIEHVSFERERQLRKGWDDQSKENAQSELAVCASLIVDDYLAEKSKSGDDAGRFFWPTDRANHVRQKYGTDYVCRLRIAAALIAAEIDRIQSTPAPGKAVE